MAVQRVSPEPVPPAGREVEDGYVWKMSDPPDTDPVVVHHDAEVVHHDAVRETRWYMSGTVEYTRYDTRLETFSDTLQEVDLGTAEPTWRSVDGTVLSGSLVTARRGLYGWTVSFPADGQASYYTTASGSMFEAAGTFTFDVGAHPEYSGTMTVSVESRDVEVSPAWDEEASPAWDEVVREPTLRKISYFGDYAGGTAPFTSPPGESGLSPASLRGEAVAYLVSGLARAASADSVGAAWDSGSGVDAAPAALSAFRPSSSPSLDLFRLRLLDYHRVRRAPLAPSVPAFTGAPFAFLDGGSADYDSADPSVPSRTGVPIPPEGAPAWGTSWDVAADQAGLDAAGGRWLAESAAGGPESAFMRFAESGLSPAECRALAGFVASASPRQPHPALGRGCGFSSGYAPGGLPGPGGAAVFQETPEPVLASDVAALFRGPPSDPSHATRCWAVCPGWLVGTDPDSLPPGAPAGDASGPDSFTFHAYAWRNFAEGGWAAAARAEWDEKWAAGGEWNPGGSVSFGLRYSDSPAGADSVPPDDVAFAAWAVSSGRAGGEEEEARWTAAYVEQVTGKAAPDGSPGNCWLIDSMTDVSSAGTSAYIPYDGQAPLKPMNYVPAQDNPPTYARRSSAAQDGRFGIVYAYARARNGTAPAVPRTGWSPLAPGGGEVPEGCADDVAAQPVFTAEVELAEELLNSDGASPSGRSRIWGVAGFVPGFGRWVRAAGVGTGEFAGTGEFVLPPTAEGLAEFAAGSVASACGLDPAALLSGSPSWRWVPSGRTVQLYKEEPDPGNPGGTRRTTVAEWPAVARVASGDAVVLAHLRVRVSVSACVFESGYCA